MRPLPLALVRRRSLGLLRAIVRLPVALHRDERGVMSFISVFAVLFLVMLLGMIINVSKQVDGKIRLQNAADDAAYAGGVVLARGLNSLAFTNNLLCECFAMTAIMREGHERNAEKYVPDILAAWKNAAQALSTCGYSKFDAVGAAMLQKIPLEQQAVDTFSEWMYAQAEITLPLIETILQYRALTEYQQAVLDAYPEIAQTAAMEVADRNGQPDYGRGTLRAALWHATGQIVSNASDSLPAVNPESAVGSSYWNDAHDYRDSLARHYLNLWNTQMMAFFRGDSRSGYWGRMSAFYPLWCGFTCGQLDKLLGEFPDTNLPFQIKQPKTAITTDSYLFVGVAYWKQIPEVGASFAGKTLFHNPMTSDSLAYAAVRVFVPRSRLVWALQGGGGGSPPVGIGGIPGGGQVIPGSGSTGTGGGGPVVPIVIRDGHGVHPVRPISGGMQIDGTKWAWDLLAQNWTVALVPADTPNLATILQSTPSSTAFGGAAVNLPNVGGVDVQQVNTH